MIQFVKSFFLQAHYHCRRAESHLRHLRFDEAIESHRKAANSLDETLQTCANNPKILESIKLQRDFQLKNIDLVRLKKAQYEKVKLAIEQQRLKNASFLEQRLAKDRIESVCDLQMSIFKTLEESDTLLETLSGKCSPGQQNHRATLDNVNRIGGVDDNNTVNKIQIADNSNDVKLPRTKSDCSIIDEMHTLNHQLHILVYNLVTRMDESSHELEVLRDRVKSIEKERNHQRKASLPISNKSSSESSSKTDDSPTLSERIENRRHSVSGEERKIVLPDSSDLPPLELPEFDYNF